MWHAPLCTTYQINPFNLVAYLNQPIPQVSVCQRAWPCISSCYFSPTSHPASTCRLRPLCFLHHSFCLLTYQGVCYVCFSSVLTCWGVCSYNDCNDFDIVENVVVLISTSFAKHILWQRDKFNMSQLPVTVDCQFTAFILIGYYTVTPEQVYSFKLICACCPTTGNTIKSSTIAQQSMEGHTGYCNTATQTHTAMSPSPLQVL